MCMCGVCVFVCSSSKVVAWMLVRMLVRLAEGWLAGLVWRRRRRTPYAHVCRGHHSALLDHGVPLGFPRARRCCHAPLDSHGTGRIVTTAISATIARRGCDACPQHDPSGRRIPGGDAMDEGPGSTEGGEQRQSEEEWQVHCESGAVAPWLQAFRKGFVRSAGWPSRTRRKLLHTGAA